MKRMKDLTQQYIEQLENMVKDLREEKLELEEENKKLNIKVASLEGEIQMTKLYHRETKGRKSDFRAMVR